MPKEQPSLADMVLAQRPNAIAIAPGNVKTVETVQRRLRSAEKMVFDYDASYRVGEMLLDIPELFVEQIQFARPPFDLCWIEYDSDGLLSGIGEPGFADANDPTRDVKVGTLIDHMCCHIFSANRAHHVGMIPFRYHLHTEWPLDEQISFAELMVTSRIGIDAWMWGACWPRLSPEYRRRLRDTNRVEMIGTHYASLSREQRASVYKYTAGDFKNIVALLLLLNQPRLTKYVHVPRRQGWVKNKPRPFMAHHTVTLALDAKAQIKLVSDGNLIPQMRRGGHWRGHYCQNKTARDYGRIAGCIHDWVPCDADWTPAPDMPIAERLHWVCRTCEGKRWWRSEHDKGGTGYALHDHYRVTA